MPAELMDLCTALSSCQQLSLFPKTSGFVNSQRLSHFAVALLSEQNEGRNSEKLYKLHILLDLWDLLMKESHHGFSVGMTIVLNSTQAPHLLSGDCYLPAHLAMPQR
jgi:hypothetical protein